MSALRTALALLAAGLAGCGGPPPSQAELDDAKARLEAAVEGADQARAALELLGILPTYDCGEPRRSFVGRALEHVKATAGCVTATTEAEGTGADLIVLTYSAGCRVRERAVSGRSVIRYNGGESRMDVEADLTGTRVDDRPVRARAGYGTCADEKRYWGAAEGQLPRRSDVWVKVDGRVGAREGPPIIGGTTLVLDGPGEVRHPVGTDRVTFDGLHYELGEYLPKEGSLVVETSSGHRVEARFRSSLWRLGQAEVMVDDRSPVTVPIIR